MISADVLRELLRDEVDERVTKTTVLRYINCISPLPLADFPDYDIDAGPGSRLGNGNYLLGPTVFKIHWTFRQSVDLYLLSAWMDDQHVCDLVVKYLFELWADETLNRWDQTRVNAVFHEWQHLSKDGLGPEF